MGFALMCLLAVWVGVVFARTVCFKPKPQPEISQEEFDFDREAAVDSLAKLVRCKTISYNDKSLEDDAEFEKLIFLLP